MVEPSRETVEAVARDLRLEFSSALGETEWQQDWDEIARDLLESTGISARLTAADELADAIQHAADQEEWGDDFEAEVLGALRAYRSQRQGP